MSIKDTIDSLMYLQERYIAPHVERVAVQNKFMTKEETLRIINNLKAKGLITMQPIREITPEQKEQMRRLYKLGYKPSAIAEMVDLPREYVKDYRNVGMDRD